MAMETASSPVAQPGAHTRTQSDAPFSLEQARNDGLFQRGERILVAKKTRDIDQKVAKQQRGFIRVFTQICDIILDGFTLPGLHAALDAAHERPRLVSAEIMPCLTEKKRANRLPRVGDGAAIVICALAPYKRLERVETSQIFNEFRRHRVDRDREIDQAARDGAVRHSREARAGRIARLRQRHAAMFLDRLDAKNAIGAAAGKNDAHRVFALISRQGTEEYVDRFTLMINGVRRLQAQAPINDRQDRAGWQDVDFVPFDQLVIVGDFDFKGGMAGEDFIEKAFPVGRQMSDDDESHPRSRRNGLEEIFQRAKTASRRANADDRKRRGAGFGIDHQFRGPIFARQMKHIRDLFKPTGFAMSPIVIGVCKAGSRRPSLPRVMRTIGVFPVVYV